MLHDYDADFMMVGYWGAGYETEIYEYDHEKTPDMMARRWS